MVEFIAFDEEEDANLEDVDLKTVKEGNAKYFIVLMNAAKTAENNRLEEARQQLKRRRQGTMRRNRRIRLILRR